MATYLQEQAPPQGTVPRHPPRDDNARVLAEVLRAFIFSRALIWAAGITTALLIGLTPPRAVALDSISHFTRPFATHLFNVLISPGDRYDSAWYLGIAAHGYHQTVESVFFPLYPLSVAIVGLTTIPQAIVGILLSCAFAVGALFLLYRLVEMDEGPLLARRTIWIVAWLPVALFLSAVYSEALFLLMSVGSIYAARQDRWWLAGVLGCLASATRNSGILLVAPLLILYLYGPRPKLPEITPARWFYPRFRLRWDVAWIALVPVGMLAYLVYLHFAIGHTLAPFTGQKHWARSFVPLGGIPLGIYSEVKSFLGVTGLDPKLAGHISTMKMVRHTVELGVLIVSASLLWFGRRRLPLAYTAFAALSLLMTVSVPAHAEPLKSLPRFTLVIFPLWISLAMWANDKRKTRLLQVVLPVLLVGETFLFVGWYFAA